MTYEEQLNLVKAVLLRSAWYSGLELKIALNHVSHAIMAATGFGDRHRKIPDAETMLHREAEDLLMGFEHDAETTRLFKNIKLGKTTIGQL